MPATGGEVAENFFSAYWRLHGYPPSLTNTPVEKYLAAPVMVAFYLFGYIWKRGKPVSALEMDLDVSSSRQSPYLIVAFLRYGNRLQTGRKSWLTVEDMRAVRISFHSHVV